MFPGPFVRQLFKVSWGTNGLFTLRSQTNLFAGVRQQNLEIAVFTLDKYRALPNAEITGVDYSEDMLLQARERFSASKLGNVTCIQGDVGDLNFGDGTFDMSFP
ncbi:class I SAM-dependent methyltransferase [Propionispora hippei]|uniref:Methyltransferase domain-containing protein n=1 Tax=Propionispora hippei DSM 15287 TaxID=1123003 RepID=A0A1M6EEW3_9FIRM|nr:class I SAM-dependent methyltransferase [Propionispora hippei]SHI84014.1 Methyltransferase domain-containing protein [Propionispora hippei DSM 15287]